MGDLLAVEIVEALQDLPACLLCRRSGPGVALDCNAAPVLGLVQFSPFKQCVFEHVGQRAAQRFQDLAEVSSVGAVDDEGVECELHVVPPWVAGSSFIGVASHVLLEHHLVLARVGAEDFDGDIAAAFAQHVPGKPHGGLPARSELAKYAVAVVEHISQVYGVKFPGDVEFPILQRPARLTQNGQCQLGPAYPHDPCVQISPLGAHFRLAM